MVLLSEKAQVEARFSPFGDSANLDARKVHGLCQNTTCSKIISWMTWVLWNLVLVHLETVFVSVQDRCTVCAKCSIDSEIILDIADGTPR